MIDAIELLRQVDLFRNLDDTQLAALAEQARELQFRKNAIMMTEGDVGESMYVIRSGLVKVYVSDEDGKELVLFQQGPGTVIGDIALLDNEPRSASISTLEKNQCADDRQIELFTMPARQPGNGHCHHPVTDATPAPGN